MKKQFLSFLFVSVFTLTLTACGKKDEPKDEPKDKGIEKTVFSYKYSDVVGNYYAKKSCIPSIGSPNILVLPICFSDSNTFLPSDKLNTLKNDLNTVFFGTSSDAGWHSVKSYYETESRGKCVLGGVVADPYTVPESYLSYAQDDVNVSFKTMQAVMAATENYFLTTGEEKSRFDLDHNGYLDGVVAIYIAPDYSNFDEPSGKGNLWAYTNWTGNDANASNPTVNDFMWASYDFMYSKDDARSIYGEDYAFGSGDTRYVNYDTHTYIHETGHMFGLQDYYDYSSYNYKPGGAFSMQDYNVGGHDPFSTMALGWTDPYIPTESMTIEIGKFQSTNEVILLTNKMNENNSQFDEYFLLEFYSPTGLNELDSSHAYKWDYPTGPSETGIRLWHVDARLLYTTGSSFSVDRVTTKPDISGYKVVEMMSNTYYSTQSISYITRLGTSYADYNLLQLIHNDELATYKPSSFLDKYSLFRNGDKFTINKFKNQFKQTGKLNSGDDFDWTFSVSISGETASISVNKVNY